MRYSFANLIIFFIEFLFGLLLVDLGLRFLFKFLGSSSSNQIVNFVYDSTAPFVQPFTGIISSTALSSGGVIEYATLIAAIAYAILAILIVQVVYYVLRLAGGSPRVAYT